MPKQILENIIFDEIKIGDTASLSKTLTQKDIDLFATVSGDVNPAHMDPVFAKNDIFHSVVGHGMWSGALISTILGTMLPGPGTIYLEQNIKFKKPVHLGDTVTITVTVQEKIDAKHIVKLDCHGVNQNGVVIIDGVATVIAPLAKIKVDRVELPQITIKNYSKFNGILDSCKHLSAIRTAVVHPVTANVVEAVSEAYQAGLIIPLLIGPIAKIQTAGLSAGVDLTAWEIINTEHSDAAAEKAVAIAADGGVAAIMKGALHTNEFMSAAVRRNSGLHTKYRISHAYVINIPTYHKILIVTDAAINISPNVMDKADICQNAINLWRMLYGYDKQPKIAILAAIELINPDMQATIDAATLCKMSDRRQIMHGILDGPLAFDNAISEQASADKEIISSVAGDADILLVPEIESGNILAKQLIFLG